MKKTDKKSKKRRLLPIVLLLLMVSFSAVSCAKLPSETEAKETETAEMEEMKEPEETKQPVETEAVTESEFPMRLENGALEIASIFQYSGPNPDAGWEEKENIGALELKNTSERYLTSAQITVLLSDGETLQFAAADIPAGQTAWVFESGNGTYQLDKECAKVEVQAEFSDDAGLYTGDIQAAGEGMTLTLTNNTEKDIQKIQVRCHILFNDVYFGGSSYVYPVEQIAAGKSTDIMAFDCIIGDAQAVWIGK